MSPLKRWHCSKCHHEWDGFCPICDCCAEVAYEMPKIKADEYDFVETIEEYINKVDTEEGGDAEL